MKKITALLLFALSFGTFAQDEIVNIPDANFKAYLVGNSAINTNNDTEISVAEATTFTGTIDCDSKSISDLTGIKSFVNLTLLWCDNNSLPSLNVSGLTSLTELYCYSNLKEICVATTSNTSKWKKDASAQWSTTCKPLALAETQSTEKEEVIKAYNFQGQEVPLDTKGEVIILLYDNGLREKTYVAE